MLDPALSVQLVSLCVAKKAKAATLEDEMNVKVTNKCQCPCGAVDLSVSGPPLFRTICHCTICQRFNDAPFADVVVFRAASVELPPREMFDFATYRPPPNVQRGKCAKCGKAAVEVFNSSLLPSLTIVPCVNFAQDASLPSPSMHIFYNHRVKDACDELPKHEGAWSSQLAFARQLISSMLRK